MTKHRIFHDLYIPNNILLYSIKLNRLNHQFLRYYVKMNIENHDFRKLCQSLYCANDIFRDFQSFRSLLLTSEKEDNKMKTSYYFRLMFCDDLFQVILMCSEKET